jgi:hypothetical protein
MNVIKVRELKPADCYGCVFARNGLGGTYVRCQRDRRHIPECNFDMASIYIEDTPEAKVEYTRKMFIGVPL